MKIVVFDFDETLGYFTEFGIFWDCLVNYFKSENLADLTQNDFDNIFDLYPEFLRPNIINILNYLKVQKKKLYCQKMMIYTNNTGPREWSQKIINFFEKKIKYKLIDQIIAAFKINGKTIEICRTTHNKTHTDLIRCTKIPENAEICFLDDTFYPEMTNDNIFYINVKPYYYDLQFDYMITKIQNSDFGKKILNHNIFNEKMMNNIKNYKYKYIQKNLKEYEIDKIIGKQLITHLQEFFNNKIKQKSIKNKLKNDKNKTKKTQKREN